MTFNRPAKTEIGKDFVRRTDQTLAGKFYRFRIRVKKYLAGTTIGGALMGVFYLVYDLVKTASSGARVVARYGYKAADAIGKATVTATKKTKAAVVSGATAFFSWKTASYVGKAAEKIITTGANIGYTALKAGADTAKFLADNTIALFVAIITVISIIYSTYNNRKKYYINKNK